MSTRSPATSASSRGAVTGDEAVGAVVVGGDYQGLGIVRSLGRHGIPVLVVDDERSIARYSKYTTTSVRVDDLKDEPTVITTLLELGRRFDLHGWVLYATREETVAAFSRHRSELQTVFRVPTPSWSVTEWAWDKRKTYQLARELGIPAPRTWNPLSVDELLAIDAQPPFAIKPAIKEHFIYATKAKAWRANDSAELVRRFEQATALVGPGETMIQELIPGDGLHQFAYCAFFKDGQPVARMTVRRRRQHPPEFGRASTYVETVELPVLDTLSERFLKAIDYYGLVELEYKLDPRDGEYKLLDVNARTWGYHTLGRRAGVDFPYLLYADQLGHPVAPCQGRAGVSWVRVVTDLPVGLVEITKGRLGLRSYLRSLRDSDEEAVFSRQDPLPGLVELALIPYLSVKRGF
jgi:predicted ATP-grasp superfamily ATP-dependent carboligase